MLSDVLSVHGRFSPYQINPSPPEPRSGFQAKFVRPQESTVLECTDPANSIPYSTKK